MDGIALTVLLDWTEELTLIVIGLIYFMSLETLGKRRRSMRATWSGRTASWSGCWSRRTRPTRSSWPTSSCLTSASATTSASSRSRRRCTRPSPRVLTTSGLWCQSCCRPPPRVRWSCHRRAKSLISKYPPRYLVLPRGKWTALKALVLDFSNTLKL